MNIKEAIKSRHSVRQYEDVPIPAEQVSELNDLISACNAESGLHIQLITDDPDCFNSLLAHYGSFKNANNYIAIVGPRSMADLDEKAGYYGQKIVLAAQMMGLNTCWVAGTYRKGKCNAKIGKDEKLVCVIAIGYGEEEGTEHKCKPMSKLCDIPEDEMPDWFKEGMDAAMKAPTAMNQQKFVVSIKKGEPVIRTRVAPLADIDLGIVKYNFETASGRRCK